MRCMMGFLDDEFGGGPDSEWSLELQLCEVPECVLVQLLVVFEGLEII